MSHIVREMDVLRVSRGVWGPILAVTVESGLGGSEGCLFRGWRTVTDPHGHPRQHRPVSGNRSPPDDCRTVGQRRPVGLADRRCALVGTTTERSSRAGPTSDLGGGK